MDPRLPRLLRHLSVAITLIQIFRRVFDDDRHSFDISLQHLGPQRFMHELRVCSNHLFHIHFQETPLFLLSRVSTGSLVNQVFHHHHVFLGCGERSHFVNFRNICLEGTVCLQRTQAQWMSKIFMKTLSSMRCPQVRTNASRSQLSVATVSLGPAPLSRLICCSMRCPG